MIYIITWHGYINGEHGIHEVYSDEATAILACEATNNCAEYYTYRVETHKILTKQDEYD